MFTTICCHVWFYTERRATTGGAGSPGRGGVRSGGHEGGAGSRRRGHEGGVTREGRGQAGGVSKEGRGHAEGVNREGRGQVRGQPFTLNAGFWTVRGKNLKNWGEAASTHGEHGSSTQSSPDGIRTCALRAERPLLTRECPALVHGTECLM